MNVWTFCKKEFQVLKEIDQVIGEYNSMKSRKMHKENLLKKEIIIKKSRVKE